ncbi:hypothetical protein NFI96_010130 [Prochilodus magdalenae]|nr:hypothetical protein NFI96_010130 [Prochilodus magdalenae]
MQVLAAALLTLILSARTLTGDAVRCPVGCECSEWRSTYVSCSELDAVPVFPANTETLITLETQSPNMQKGGGSLEPNLIWESTQAEQSKKLALEQDGRLPQELDRGPPPKEQQLMKPAQELHREPSQGD